MYADSVGRDDEQELLLRAVRRVDVGDVARRLTDSLRADPGYGSLVRAGDAGLGVSRWNIDLFLRWIAERRPPSEQDLNIVRALARERAVEGMPAQELIRAYRDGFRFGWRALLEAARDDERPALVDAADAFFHHLDLISRAVGDEYAEVDADRHAGHGEERDARALMTTLTRDAEPSAENSRYAKRIGFHPGPALTAFVLAVKGASASRHAEVARRLRDDGVLAVTEDERVLGLAATSPRAVLAELGEGLLAIEAEPRERGRLAVELDDLRRLLATALLEGRSGVIGPHEYLLELLLLRSPDIADRVERLVFDNLCASGHQELARTLEMLVKHGFDRAATAAALPVHRNTMTYRVRRLEEISGLDLNRPEQRALAWLAVRRRSARVLPPGPR